MNLLESLQERRNQSAYRAMDVLFATATGALSLTIAFRGDLTAGAAHIWLLKAAWCGFVLGGLSAMLARTAEILIFQKLIQRFHDYSDVVAAAPAWWQIAAFFSAYVFFVSAAIALAAFGIANL
jgi:hypothetical protein